MLKARAKQVLNFFPKNARILCTHLTPITSRIHGKKFAQITIGVPRESHPVERSAPLDAFTVQRLVDAGFKVNVESRAGEKSFISDELYAFSGAEITDAARALGADLVVKGLSPTEEEAQQMRPNSALFCQFSDNFGKTLKILQKRKVDVFDANRLCNGFYEKYTEGVKAALAEFGTNWRVIAEILNAYGKPLCAHKNSDNKAVPAAKIFVEHGFVGSQYNQMLEDLGAQVELGRIDDDFQPEKYDIVLLSHLENVNTTVYSAEITKSMAPGSILIDAHEGETPRYVGSKADDVVEEENGVKVVAIDTSKPMVRGAEVAAFRGAVFFNALRATTRDKAFDLSHSMFREAQSDYETPENDQNEKVFGVEKFRRAHVFNDIIGGSLKICLKETFHQINIMLCLVISILTLKTILM